MKGHSTQRKKIGRRIREAVFRRAYHKCEECGDQTLWRLEIDHIEPVAEGGTNDPRNLRVLCVGCHRKRHGKALVAGVGSIPTSAVRADSGSYTHRGQPQRTGESLKEPGMALYGSTAQYENAEPGMYRCTLKEIEEKEQPDYNDKSLMVTRWVWTFEALDETDSKGKPFKFMVWTGTCYGGKKARLTQLVNEMNGRAMDPADFADFDVQQWEGQQFNVLVTVKTKDDGTQKNEVVSTTPIKKNAQKPAANGNGRTPSLKEIAAMPEPVLVGAGVGDDEPDLGDPFND